MTESMRISGGTYVLADMSGLQSDLVARRTRRDRSTLSPFGQRLHDALHKKGWSRARLARALGTSDKTVDRYETGERSPPLDFINRAAEVLGIDPADLTSGAPPPLVPNDAPPGWRDFEEKGYVQFFQIRGATPEMFERARARRYKGAPTWRDHVEAMEREMIAVEAEVPPAVLAARRRNAEIGRPPPSGLVKPPKKR